MMKVPDENQLFEVLKHDPCAKLGTQNLLGTHYLGRYYIFRHSNLVYSNEIQEINMSSNTCHFQFLCDTHAEKYNTALNSDSNKC